MKKTPPALVLFTRDSLSRDEQFIYIADDQTVVGKERDRGALKLWTRREWRQG
jgi:hypothetical protein